MIARRLWPCCATPRARATRLSWATEGIVGTLKSAGHRFEVDEGEGSDRLAAG